MIRRNPALPDHIFELVRHNSFGDYMRTYGDEITRRYEDCNLIYFPYFPLNFDLDFIRSLALPVEWKKIGTVNGIENSIFKRQGNVISIDEEHVFVRTLKNATIAGYFQNQVALANSQIRSALATLFPHYHSLDVSNITWRMTETVNEVMHLDAFHGGRPVPSSKKGTTHRVKAFINVDTEPRKWWVSYITPELLKRYREQLPDILPDDIDMLNFFVTDAGVFNDAPYHEVDIPPMGAVIGESRVIPHAIRFGRRMIAAECFVQTGDMLDPSKNPDVAVKGWLRQANIGIDPDPKPFVATGKGGTYK